MNAQKMDSLLSAIRPHAAALPDSGIMEIVQYGQDRADLIKLWVGEGDWRTPDFICDAADRALRAGRTFYTWQRGLPPLRDALSAYLERIHGVPVDRERIVVTVGGMQAVMESMKMLLGEGYDAVIPTPMWPNAMAAMQASGGSPTCVPIRLGNRGWSLDIDELFGAVGSKTRALYINSPNNPTGWVMSRDEMIAIRDFARARGLWIVSDEVYARFYYGGGDRAVAPSFLEVMEPDERLIVINTFSKNWAMSGWRLGWAVLPPELVRVFENLIHYSTSGAAEFLQHGALAAIRDGEPFVEQILARSRAGRDIVIRRLAEFPRVRFSPPAGAFYGFFAVDGEPDSLAFAKRLVDQAGVGMAPGTAFGPDGAGYVRLCYATSADLLDRAFDKMAPSLR